MAAAAIKGKGKGRRPAGQVNPTKHKRRTTEAQRNFRFQSFSERIANLKIDPIRKRRYVEGQDELPEASSTYFGQALQDWMDMNLSQTFTAFAKEAAPLCDSLPMVLHNEHNIMDVLVRYIEKGDALAMEPLLSLLSHFAHDLDVRFEKHFSRAVATVTAVAASHKDFAVIEWSFMCLAWLFKYLSRLLAPDLRPLYDLMAPYLGKVSQRPFVVRFSAEAMSFLLRKAAEVQRRNSDALDLIIRHMLEDCVDSASAKPQDLHRQGVMTLLTGAVKGVQNEVHSCGLPILQSLLEHGLQLCERSDVAEEILVGVLTSLMHHCTIASKFQPVVSMILDFAQSPNASKSPSATILIGRTLFTIVSVRQGSRISDWKAVTQTTTDLLHACGSNWSISSDVAAPLLSTLAVILQTAPPEGHQYCSKIPRDVRASPFEQHFLRFCDISARLGLERFERFVLPQLQAVISARDGPLDDDSLSLINHLSPSGLKLKLSTKTVDCLLTNIDKFSDYHGDSEAELIELAASANASLAALAKVELDGPSSRRLQEALQRLLSKTLGSSAYQHPHVRSIALGRGLAQILDLGDSLQLGHFWDPLCRASAACVDLPPFWSNLNRFLGCTKVEPVDGTHYETLETAIMRCLSSPSHSIRQDALDLLQGLYERRGRAVPPSLSIMISIESTPMSPEDSLNSSIYISKEVRRLAAEYAGIPDGDLLQRALPSYCFGLLHIHLAQAWDDAMSALVKVCESKSGEDVVIELAQLWIDGQQSNTSAILGELPTVIDGSYKVFRVESDFECTNLAKLSAISQQVFSAPLGGLPSPMAQLEIEGARVPYITSNSRGQALKLLGKIPQLAEKRSRLLVPVLLRWAGEAGEDDAEGDGRTGRWTRKDQKAMLAVFAQFSNPRVLYKSAEVYTALLSLCANGDVEIQQSALKAVAAWKQPAILRHMEHLTNLLDGARFREEISVFLQDDENEGAIQPDEYDVLMPVLLRLLYGRAIAGGKEGRTDRRKAIFVALSRFGESVLSRFLDVTLSSLVGSNDECDSVPSERALQDLRAPLRQQLGFLNMTNDMLQTLGSELEPLSQKLLYAILLCTVSASRSLYQDPTGGALQTSLLRTIRQTGIQCLVKIFSDMNDFEPSQHGKFIVEELVEPRLVTFVEENAQSISGTLRLFNAWSGRSATARLFLGAGQTMLQSTANLLCGYHTKEDVRLFILQDILGNLVAEAIDESILQPAVSDFVKAIGRVIQQQPSKPVLDASVKAFSHLAGRIINASEAAEVVKTCTELLRKPGKDVSQSTKSDLLRTLVPLIERFRPGSDDLYAVVCPLFSRLQESSSRIVLAQVLRLLVREDSRLEGVAQICEDMTAMGSRLDEPDYDRRETAFQAAYDSCQEFDLQQWLLIVHICLFFIRDPEDRVNRSSASHALNLFIDAVANHLESPEWLDMLDHTVFSGVEFGMRAPSELVRAEHLIVLGHMVEKLPQWSKVKHMQPLLAMGGDRELSFFRNVLHIQQHSRLGALKGLAREAHQLDNNLVTKIFLPLVEHFVFDQVEGDAGRTLSDQAVQTIGVLAQAVNWASFRATFQRYVGYLKSRPELEKTVLRLLGSMVDGLNVEMAKAHSASMIKDHLPPLLEYLHQKDESTVDRRMPVAVTIVKLLRMLPEDEFAARLPAVLTDVSHVLKSRSQEARDQTRRSLATITSLVGSQYFRFIIKELRGALKRGYQLHVLSFTVHSLLVSSGFQSGDLDECVPDLMLVIMDDVFGVTGQEKDAEEYKSGMKEVKSSKSFDTMELLAQIIPVSKLGELVRPIRALLSERIDLKIVKKIDDLLTRLRKGLDQNPASESRDMLSFCWEIINQVHVEESADASPAARGRDRVTRYIVLPEAKEVKTQTTATSFRFKLISFALNLLRKVLRRHDDLQTPQNLSGFLPIIGDAMVQGQEEVKLAAVRLLSTIMKVPMPQLEANGPVYLKEAVAMVKGAANTTTDASKAALELITSILRDKRSVQVREKDVAVILKTIKADIDEPDRQGIIYRFIRALVGRKIVITEVYEVMDEVGNAMVTNPDRSIRESARSAYVQFVMDFPQGKDRWQKQTAFMIGNLRYEHASGRLSVLEFMQQIFEKIGDDLLQEVVVRMFVSLLPVLVSDSDLVCREKAGLLIGMIFELANHQKLSEIMTMMDTWLRPEKKATTKSGSLQCWAVLLRATRASQKQIDDLLAKLTDFLTNDDDADREIVTQALQTFTVLVEVDPATGFGKKTRALWSNIQSLYESPDLRIRELVAELMGRFFRDFESASPQIELGEGEKANKKHDLALLPLRGSGGLELGEEDMRRLCAIHLRALRLVGQDLPPRLVSQTVRNLDFLGRCFAANGTLWRGLAADGHDEKVGDQTDSEDDAEDGAQGGDRSGRRSALEHLLMRLSKVVLRPLNAPTARLASMACIGSLVADLTVGHLPVQHILRPLYALTDPAIPNPPTDEYNALEQKAHELLDQLQKKLGNQAFVAALAVTRANAKARRDQRRQKRRIEAVSAPEKWAKDKRKKYEAKKAKTKAKGEEARGKRRGW